MKDAFDEKHFENWCINFELKLIEKGYKGIIDWDSIPIDTYYENDTETASEMFLEDNICEK